MAPQTEMAGEGHRLVERDGQQISVFNGRNCIFTAMGRLAGCVLENKINPRGIGHTSYHSACIIHTVYTLPTKYPQAEEDEAWVPTNLCSGGSDPEKCLHTQYPLPWRYSGGVTRGHRSKRDEDTTA